MSEINNITDQIEGFADEVVGVIRRIEKQGFTTEQSIRIVELAIKDMEVEVLHQKNKKLDAIGESIYMISQNLGE